MKKTITIAILALCLVACGSYRPISTSTPSNNGTYKVSYLFEHEGVQVYRFDDNGRYVYFTKGGGSGIVTSIGTDSTASTTYTIVQEEDVQENEE